MISCREFADFLMDYLDRTLPDGESRTFEEHMELCPQCVHYLESYEETIRLGKLCREPDAPVPDEVPEALVEAVLAARRRRS